MTAKEVAGLLLKQTNENMVLFTTFTKFCLSSQLKWEKRVPPYPPLVYDSDAYDTFIILRALFALCKLMQDHI